MATSPDFLRLAANATRALADTALDSLPIAVLVIDSRHKHLPLVLANSAARRCLIADKNAATLIETPLARLLGTASAAGSHSLRRSPNYLAFRPRRTAGHD
jgi:hypothetical protein